MVLDDCLTPGGILEMGVAASRASGDSRELDADVSDSLFQAVYVVGIELAECRGEGFDVIEADFVSFLEAPEDVPSPRRGWVTALGVGGVLDAIARSAFGVCAENLRGGCERRRCDQEFSSLH